ncbi:MAG: PA domain-containing protein [Verrucomicrobiota bacterium]
MKVTTLSVLCLFGSLLASYSVRAADFVFVNQDAAGVGLNDTTPVSPVGGNPGTTLGQQRLFALEEVGRIWGQFLQSDVPIRVGVRFGDLGSGGALAQAGPDSFEVNFTGAPERDVFYPIALANSLAGFDLEPTRNDLSTTININLDSTVPRRWYYGFDGQPSGSQVDFIDVVLHEVGHGLGFSAVTSFTSGNFLFGRPAVYATFLEDLTLGLRWTEMTSAQRLASVNNDPNVVWNGPSTIAGAPSILQAGNISFEATSPASFARSFSFAEAGFGPAITGNPITAEIVEIIDGAEPTNDACSDILNGFELAGKIAFLSRGTCNFDDKIFRAQQAGAIAVVVGNNVGGAPIVMGGDSVVNGQPVTISIPSIMISQTDASAIRAQLDAATTVIVRLGASGELFGANQGKVRVHAPSSTASGSSISHWSTATFPNLLMEPSINRNLRDDLDLSLTALRDMGWVVLDIPYPHLTLELWQEENFPSAGSSALANADPDFDGLTNLEEYAFGENPNSSTSNAFPVFQSMGDTQSIAYSRSVTATDINYSYEYSTDLTNWLPAEVGVDIGAEVTTPLGSEAERVSVEIIRNDPRVFLRLRLEQVM